MYKCFFKPLGDKLFSLLLLLFFSPLIIFTILVLYFTNENKEIFFLQTRPGKNAKLFKIVKFKTMNDQRDISGKLLPDSIRLTPFGKFLRRLSIDEILQLINVLKGDMSLIGPRPLLIQYLDRYSIEQARRHLVKPGISGWAQVNGRNSLSWSEKFQLDIFYVENMNFLLDLKIIFMTFKSVFTKSGINQSENIPMNEFMGNN